MKVYEKNFHQYIPTSLNRAWDFFSDPGNLKEITPPDMDFKILSKSVRKVYPGQVINYSVRPLIGYKMSWLTKIVAVKEKDYFIDQQLEGPYKLWHHEHRFYEENGGVVVEDTINYSVPFGFLGRILNSLLISYRIDQIFDFRKNILNKKFPQ